MKNMKSISLIVLFVLIAGVLAVAHNGVEHIKGTVTAVSDKTITIKTADNQTKVVNFSEKTVFEKSKKSSTVKNLHVGDKVVVDYHDMSGMMHAVIVRFGVQPASNDKHTAEHHDHN